MAKPLDPAWVRVGQVVYLRIPQLPWEDGYVYPVPVGSAAEVTEVSDRGRCVRLRWSDRAYAEHDNSYMSSSFTATPPTGGYSGHAGDLAALFLTT